MITDKNYEFTLQFEESFPTFVNGDNEKFSQVIKINLLSF